MEDLFYQLLAKKPGTVRDKLIKNGYKVKLLKTSPPTNKMESGQKRVIALKKTNSDTVQLIWSYENFN